MRRLTATGESARTRLPAHVPSAVGHLLPTGFAPYHPIVLHEDDDMQKHPSVRLVLLPPFQVDCTSRLVTMSFWWTAGLTTCACSANGKTRGTECDGDNAISAVVAAEARS